MNSTKEKSIKKDKLILNKVKLLEDNDVKEFVNFLAEKWDEGLKFNVGIKKRGSKAVYIPIVSLKDMLDNYYWEYSINTSPKDFPKDSYKGSTLNESEAVLSYCKNKLINNKGINTNEDELRVGTEIVFRWGGVFTKGNKIKATDKNYDLQKDYKEVIQKWNNIYSKNADFSSRDKFDFTSNAGFTKVYSLILPDFIIYDSRVSVALAYLINLCFNGIIPEILNIYIPAPRGVNTERRTVNSSFLPTNQNNSRHFYSNVIASLLLSESLKLISDKDNTVKLRDLEASLFMMGYDVSRS